MQEQRDVTVCALERKTILVPIGEATPPLAARRNNSRPMQRRYTGSRRAHPISALTNSRHRR